MAESVEDGTEGGYIAGEIPAEQLEKMRQQRPEFFVTDTDMVPRLTEAYQKALIEKYGHIPELNEMVAVEEQPDD